MTTLNSLSLYPYKSPAESEYTVVPYFPKFNKVHRAMQEFQYQTYRPSIPIRSWSAGKRPRPFELRRPFAGWGSTGLVCFCCFGVWGSGFGVQGLGFRAWFFYLGFGGGWGLGWFIPGERTVLCEMP